VGLTYWPGIACVDPMANPMRAPEVIVIRREDIPELGNKPL
jgi:hypothetical protein